MTISVRPLTPADRAQWEPLWKGYQAFYKTVIPDDVTDLTWSRFHDPHEPMHALGAFRGEKMLGIVHYIFHRSCWTRGDYCYLQDLFTAQEARGMGVGRALIEAVYAAAKDQGANRVHWLTQHDNATAMQLYDNIADKSGFVQYRKLI